MSQTTPARGRFVQFPIALISGRPDLTRDDKWVLLSLMEDHWTEEPFSLSYREIARTTGVPLSLLSSFTNKKTGAFREGIMDRIERTTGYIHCFTEKELDPKTGKPKGNAKTFIKINYTKIWQDNIAYTETLKPVSYTNRFEGKGQPVSYANGLGGEPVSNTNEPVSYADTPVSHANKLVSYANEPVSHANGSGPLSEHVEPLEAAPNTNNTITYLKDNKDKGISGDSQPFDEDTSSSDTHTHFYIDATNTQKTVSSDMPEEATIDTVSFSSVKNTELQPSKPKRGKQAQVVTQPPLAELPLIEPEMKGTWRAETVVTYVEYRNDKRYQENERKRQLDAARAIHRDDNTLTLEQFKQAYDERDDDWWHKAKGKLHVTHMKGKEQNSGMDRLHAMLDRIETRNSYKTSPKVITMDCSPEAVAQAATKNRTQLERLRAITEKKMKESKENERQQHQQHHAEGSIETEIEARVGVQAG